METIILKCLVAGYLVLGLQAALAQSTIYEKLAPGSCSHMSKNPRCWERKDHTNPPRPTRCHSKDSCHVIESVHEDSWGQFHCRDVNGHRFSCIKLVEQFGTHIEGFMVKVTTPHEDACHVPGRCGPRACVPSYGAASMDSSCQVFKPRIF